MHNSVQMFNIDHFMSKQHSAPYARQFTPTVSYKLLLRPERNKMNRFGGTARDEHKRSQSMCKRRVIELYVLVTQADQ
jgi:hypothetical protein